MHLDCGRLREVMENLDEVIRSQLGFVEREEWKQQLRWKTDRAISGRGRLTRR